MINFFIAIPKCFLLPGCVSHVFSFPTKVVFFSWTVCTGFAMHAAAATPVTPEDIVRGMTARGSRIEDIQFENKVTLTSEPIRRQRWQEMVAEQYPDAPPEDRLPPSEITASKQHHYRFAAMGNHLRYWIFEPGPPAGKIGSTATFDGEVLRSFHLLKMNGTIDRELPENVFTLPTAPKMLGVNNVPLASYMTASDVESQITGITQDKSGDLLVAMVLRREFLSTPDLRQWIETECLVNVSKDFWPIRIEQFEVFAVEKPAPATYRIRKAVVRVEQFVDEGGVHYPVVVVKEAYVQSRSHEEGIDPRIAAETTVISQTNRLETVELKINSGLSPQDFEMVYPDGVRYVDLVTDTGGFVGESAEALANRMKERDDLRRGMEIDAPDPPSSQPARPESLPVSPGQSAIPSTSSEDVPPTSVALRGTNDMRMRSGCGLQCMKLILHYYNVPYIESELAKELRLTPDGGCTLSDLERTAARYGLQGAAYKLTVAELLSVSGPVLVHIRVQDNNVGHFIVVRTTDGMTTAYDPTFSGAPSEVDIEVFEKNWSGYAFVFGPNDIDKPRDHVLQASFTAVLAMGLVSTAGAVFMSKRKRQRKGA